MLTSTCDRNSILTVDLDLALARGLAHVVGGPDLVLVRHPAAHRVDGEAVEAAGVLVDLDARVLGDVRAALEPGHGRGGGAGDLALEDDLRTSRSTRHTFFPVRKYFGKQTNFP